MTTRIAFPHVGRDRPIVLTRHDIAKLSREAGRNVEPELNALSCTTHEAKTFRQLMRTLSAALKRP